MSDNMIKLITMFGIVLFILFCERTIFLTLTRNKKGIAWVRRNRWIHPNPICWYRLPMGVVTYLFWVNGFAEFATIWCAFWMLTDMTDGTVARGCDLGTPTGEWLDPLSDKCMYIPVLYLLTFITPENAVGYQTIDFLPFIIFTTIDILGQASRLWVKKKAANSFGKAKTTIICTLLIFMAMQFNCYEAFSEIPILNKLNMNHLMWSGVILAFLSFYCKLVPDIWYANSLTSLNLICGIAAIYVVFSGAHVVMAFALIFTGQFFDLLDGRTARKFGSTRWGALFDDIADGTSFGVAIGCIIFIQTKSINLWLAIAVALLYVACVFYRLYKFLINSKSAEPGIFTGLPSPGGAMLAGSSALLFTGRPWIIIVASIVASVFMISKIRYKHFGQKIWSGLPNGLKLALFASMLIYFTLLFKAQEHISLAFAFFCFTLIIIYMIVGVAIKKTAPAETEE